MFCAIWIVYVYCAIVEMLVLVEDYRLVLAMDEAKKAESHMTSAAAFVEGGIQEACDDSCSICLEGFCDGDPSTVTSCKHEFHLQCILECSPPPPPYYPHMRDTLAQTDPITPSNFTSYPTGGQGEGRKLQRCCVGLCQRSSNCPMCWQNISLKDPTSQELLEAVERERSFRFTPSRNARIFHHPALGDFELQHLPVGVNDAELEDRIIQHLAAAAAMGRTHRIGRREGSRSRTSAHARPQFVVLSANPNGSSTGAGSEETEPAAATENNTSVPLSNQISASSSGSLVMPITGRGYPLIIGSVIVHKPYIKSCNYVITWTDFIFTHFQKPCESAFLAKSRQSRTLGVSVFFRHLEISIQFYFNESTKELKEKLFSRSSSVADIGSEVRREVNAGIATVSRMMERLETRDNNRADRVLRPNSAVNSSVTEQRNNNRDTPDDMPLNGNNSSSFAASSISS
ncbi:hypothetical protein DH2020_039764 [Rehmannia glutinosa]|uniref:RING-type E3 ubiquitin transferase n=1 Tax=Rehmannia glutinosa TaxID=99300 RepID=A0ABR0UWX2_REHGL